MPEVSGAPGNATFGTTRVIMAAKTTPTPDQDVAATARVLNAAVSRPAAAGIVGPLTPGRPEQGAPNTAGTTAVPRDV